MSNKTPNIMLKNYFLLFTLIGCLTGFSQTIVSTDSQNKKVVIEEFTGVACQYCPIGHTIVQNLIDDNPGNVFAIKIHEGGYAEGYIPDFTTQWGTSIVSQSNNGGSYPSGTINRQVISSASSNGGTSIALGWNNINSNPFITAVEQVLLQSAYVNVGVEANLNVLTRELSVHVEAYYTGNSPESTNLLNIALLQNNTTGPQSGEGGGSEYNHTHRLVHMLTGQWGETINETSTGSFIDRNYTYTVPASYNNVDAVLADLEVIAFVSETQQNIISGAEATPFFDGLEYSNDASLLSIENNLNGNCGETASPVIVIQNFGTDPINSLSIEYSINSGSSETYSWSGSLESLQSTSIELPSIGYSPSDTNSVNITISDDENNDNNSNIFYFDQSSSYDTAIVTLNLITDNYASETSWQLTDSSGYIIAQNGSLTNASTYNTEIEIPSADECYTFTINDSYGDGICCQYGTGSYSITDDSSNVIFSGGEFSSTESTIFRVGETLGINPVFENDLNIFPNPSNGVFTIKSSINNSTYKIYNLIGQHVKSGSINNGSNLIDLRNSTDGVYFITIQTENGEKIGYKLIKN